jgi:lipopolysaccharide export LptBFGC system permease protein LptF
MASEPKLILLNVIAVILTFVFPRARVLTLPFFFIGFITALFWSARVSADRMAEKEKEGGS